MPRKVDRMAAAGFQEEPPPPRTTCSPRLLRLSEAVAAYRLIHRRVDGLARGRADIGEWPVPACPAWTIRHLVAHLAGVAQDIVSLNVEKKGTAPWARAQVDRLSGNQIDESLDLWSELLDPATATLTLSNEESACQLVFDTLCHEHDLRGAMDEPGSRTGDLAYQAAMGFLTTMADRFIRQAQLPALRLSTPAVGVVQLGDPHTAPAQLALETSDFEALRALGGRRSVRQLLALPWHGDPTGLLPAFTQLLPAFTDDGIRPPREDLIE